MGVFYDDLAKGRDAPRQIVFIANENYLTYDFIMNENPWKARWSQDQIRDMLLEQFVSLCARDTGTERTQLAEIERAADVPHAVIISGLRRVGKSTLLAHDHRQKGRSPQGA